MRSLRLSAPVLRWSVPAAVAATVVAGVLADSSGSSSAAPGDLRLVSAIRTADLPELTGAIRIDASTQLPALPALAGLTGTGPVSGSATARIWLGAGGRSRVELDSAAGRVSLYRDGPRLTTWDGHTVTRMAAGPAADPASGPTSGPTSAPTSVAGSDPLALARSLLAGIDRDSAVSIGRSTTVAGRAARVVDIRPTDRHSLIGRIRLAVDVPHRLPLSVQVTARGRSSAALTVAFTQLRFGPPSVAALHFTAPAGAPVRTVDPTGALAATPSELRTVRIVGSGWRTVLVSARPAGQELDKVIADLPRVSGSWGTGRLFRSSLVSALITDDGRLLVGAVDPQTLYAAAR